MSELVVVDPRRSDHSVVERIGVCLKSGGVVVGPTDTRYGLLVRADQQEAIERLLKIKQRDLLQPVAIMILDRDLIGEFATETALSQRLAERLLPGPVTLVLRATKDWPPPRVVDGLIGIRCVDLPLIRGILAAVSFPLTATSANRSGQKDWDRVADIRNELGDDVDLYVEAGALTGPVSTVIDCSGEFPRILRQGAVSAETVMKAAKG